MTLSRRNLFGLGAGLLSSTALTACGGAVTATVVVSAAQAIANDAAAILGTGQIPAAIAAIASEVLTGFQALITVVENATSTGASTESTVLAGLTSAIRSVIANTPTTSTVNKDAGIALTVLGGLSANSSASLQVQAEAAVGTVLIAYLEANAPASVSASGEESPIPGLLTDAKGHLAALKNGS